MKNSPSEYVSSRSSFQAGVVSAETPDSAIKTLTPAKTEAEHEIKLEGAFNVRDLGGFITKDGRQIKAHRLLRSARLNHLTANDITQLTKIYHVGIDFDLRRPQEVAAQPDVRMPGVTYITNTDCSSKGRHYYP